MTVKTVGYVRVSKEDQAKDVKSSLRDQKATIERKATVALWFEDNKSAFKDVKRPAFDELVAYCKAHPTTVGEVWVRNASRFSRKDPDETAYNRHLLKIFGWTVCYAEGDEVQEPTGRAVNRAMQDIQAHSESVNRSVRVKDGQRGTAEQGFCIGKTPYGYLRRIVKHGVPGELLQRGDQKPPGTNTIYWPEGKLEQRNVVWAFETYATGRHSTYYLADELRKRDPSWPWTSEKVCRLLRTVAYTGTYVACHGAVNRPDNHTPLVSRELWHRCQAVMFTNRHQTRAVNGEYLLSGLIQCGDCGGNIVCTGGAVKWKQYGCATHRRADGTCTQGMSFTQHVVDPMVIDAIASVASSAETHDAIDAEWDRMFDMSTASVSGRRKVLTQRRDKLERQRTNLIRVVAAGKVTDEEVQTTLQPIRDELEEVKSEIQQLRFAERQPKALDAQRREVVEAAKDFRTLINHVPTAQAKELLRPWLEQAVTTADPRGITLRIRMVPEFASLKPLKGYPEQP